LRVLLRILPFFIFLFISLQLAAQKDCVIQGVVVDEQGNSMPFVNIYYENTNKGTSSNFDGHFSIRCHEDQSRRLVFQYIGYQIAFLESQDFTQSKLQLQLVPLDIKLPEFQVSAKAKDPAYEVIKQAQKHRKFHLDQFDNFSADIYMKSSARLNEIPDKIPGFISIGNNEIDSTDLGIIYLSESVATFHLNKPNLKEEMGASKISGYNHAYSWNRVKDLLFNFYDNNLEFRGVSKRNFVSPIGGSAFFYYDYKLLGTFYEDERMINKIKVIPKRNHDPVFHGIIYIVEDEWAIHSLDLFVTKDAQIEYADTIKLKQSYVELEKGYRMPLSLEINYHYSIFGFKAEYYSIGVFSNYALRKEFPKNYFSNEVFKVQEEANQQNIDAWEGYRSVVLTEEETENYKEQDSLYQVRNSPEYMDSVDRVNNRFKPFAFIISPYTYQISKDSVSWKVLPLVRSLQYNTVEGRVANFVIERTNWRGRGVTKVTATARYGLASNQPYGKLAYVRRFNSLNYSTFRISGGSFAEQINENEPIHPFINSMYSGLVRENYMKIFEKSFLKSAYSRELVNGLFVYAEAEYARRVPLNNRSEFSYFYRDKEFTANRFENDMANNMASFSIDFAYRHKQKYASYPHRKRILGSDYPTVYAGIKRGQGVGNNSEYTLVRMGLSYDVKMGLTGVSKFDVYSGKFISGSNVSFFDMVHFDGNQTIINSTMEASSIYSGRRSRKNQFHTLPYYLYSTNSAYVHLHYVHHFNGFIINKIPFLRKTKFRSLVGANVLYTEASTNLVNEDSYFRHGEYIELFVGLENIFKILRVDFATFYQKNEPIKPAFRISLDF
jgi:hypothetical protein